MKPRVAVFTLGGTIASAPRADGHGAEPALGAQALLDAVPGLSECAELDAVDVRRIPSVDLTLADLVSLAGAIDARLVGGADGVVVVQGTDTLEETAFALDLLVAHPGPVVVTGAMRNPGLPGADGPANLLAAVQIAASPSARDVGCVAVMGDEIHAARFVRKVHTSSVAAFRSPTVGPIGWMVEGRPRIAFRPAQPRVSLAPPDREIPAVALVAIGLGEDARLVSALHGLGYAGVVLEALGGGHVPARVMPAVEQLVSQMPVVVASRAGAGELLRSTYGFRGSELDLLAHGAISAGSLDGPKARVLLALLLGAGAERDALGAAFASIGWLEHDAHDSAGART